MKIEEYIINGIGLISAFISIWQAWKARTDRKAIEVYKDALLVKMKSQDIGPLYESALKTQKIIIKYRSLNSNTYGLDKNIDRAIILEFISKIRENQGLFQENVALKYFNDMNDALKKAEYNNMFIYTSQIIELLKKAKDSLLL
jgi:hypothetical protein